ncbi:MAG: HAD family hydrolase, partial [Rhodothermales bacterium]|nr:HAD family hydrolase [Rhodothermales bacterium]
LQRLLILDLDETLIHGTRHPLGRPADFVVDPYHIYRRPHLDEFLLNCSQHYEMAVWTSAGADYAREVVDEIWPPGVDRSFLWSRERCTYRENLETRRPEWIKDLKKVKKAGYPLERIVMVDDNPEKLSRQYGNLVRVRPYYGELRDDELPWLSRFLSQLAAVDNVREVEKRGWRERLEAESSESPQGTRTGLDPP